MRRLVLVSAATFALVLAATAPSAAQEIGPTPYWTFPSVGPTPNVECPPFFDVGPAPYYVGPSPYAGPLPYYVVCEAGAPGVGPLPQTGTSLALIAGSGVVVMLLGLWAARRRATS